MYSVSHSNIRATLSGLSLQTPRAQMVFLAIITPLYLLFELSFGADLLDLVGRAPTLEEIEHIEVRGRFIAGIALTLFAWSAIVFPASRKYRLKDISIMASLVVSAGLCILASYQIQEAIIRGIVKNSTIEDRQAAVILSMATRAVQAGDIGIEGFPVLPEHLETPSGKAFLALLPALSLKTGDLVLRAEPVLERLALRSAISDLGASSGLFEDYQREMDRLRADHIRILPAIQAYHARIEALEIEAHVAQRWSEFENKLLSMGLVPGAIPGIFHARVREDMSGSGYDLPDDWDPNDGQGFRDMIRLSLKRPEIDAFLGEIDIEFAAPEIEFSDFAQSPAAQMRLMKIGIVSDMPVDAGLSKEEFETVYRDSLLAIAEERISAMRASADTFGTGGDNDYLGEQAVKTVWIPAVALVFSIIGAISHIVKSGLLAVKVGLKKHSSRKFGARIVIVIAACLVILPGFAGNDITGHKTYQDLRAARGGLVAHTITWIIKSQPVFYGIGNMVQRLS